jgi:hypothetical protein
MTAIMLVDPAFDSFPYPNSTSPSSTILKNETKYDSIAALWKDRKWEKPNFVTPARDVSQPYHAGSTTFADGSTHDLGEIARAEMLRSAIATATPRNMSSPLDEIVFHWTEIAGEELIKKARNNAADSAYYLLKYVGHQYTNLLELIACGVAESEYYADDYQANIDTETRDDKNWRDQLKRIIASTKGAHTQGHATRVIHAD